jgi:hypothetical protein
VRRATAINLELSGFGSALGATLAKIRDKRKSDAAWTKSVEIPTAKMLIADGRAMVAGVRAWLPGPDEKDLTLVCWRFVQFEKNLISAQTMLECVEQEMSGEWEIDSDIGFNAAIAELKNAASLQLPESVAAHFE